MARVICIDAGHGANNPNGVPQMREFEFNRVVAQYAKELAEHNNFKVVLTQPIDKNARNVELPTRTKIATDAKAEMLFSIHADANDNVTANGFWAFYWHDYAPSKRLAELWIRHAVNILKIHNRGTHACRPKHWANFHMVREPAIGKHKYPAILMEHGFMTNAGDLKMLMSDEYRRRCAEVLVRSACEYFGLNFRTNTPQVQTNTQTQAQPNTQTNTQTQTQPNTQPTRPQTNMQTQPTRPQTNIQAQPVQTQTNFSKHFKDITDTRIAGHIDDLFEKGIIRGRGNGIFDPNSPITRAEVAILISRTIDFLTKK